VVDLELLEDGQVEPVVHERLEQVQPAEVCQRALGELRELLGAAAQPHRVGVGAVDLDPQRRRLHAHGEQLLRTFVNAHGAAHLDERAPFGGFDHSGMGREMGIEGVREFMDTHAVGFPV
jgi:acyl-CoA reductase-like NAD-dependent aldehyde dehydrogenase